MAVKTGWPVEVEMCVKDLEKRGVHRFTAGPPIYRFLWARGLSARPPLLQTFLSNFAISGVWFGSAWGLGMLFIMGWPARLMIMASLVAGIAFGLWMAIYFRIVARRHKLPTWDTYKAGAAHSVHPE
jgi:hypothetical protein